MATGWPLQRVILMTTCNGSCAGGPPRSLVAGVPGKVRRELSDAELTHNRHNAAVYEGLVELHRHPD